MEVSFDFESQIEIAEKAVSMGLKETVTTARNSYSRGDMLFSKTSSTTIGVTFEGPNTLMEQKDSIIRVETTVGAYFDGEFKNYPAELTWSVQKTPNSYIRKDGTTYSYNTLNNVAVEIGEAVYLADLSSGGAWETNGKNTRSGNWKLRIATLNLTTNNPIPGYPRNLWATIARTYEKN